MLATTSATGGDGGDTAEDGMAGTGGSADASAYAEAINGDATASATANGGVGGDSNALPGGVAGVGGNAYAEASAVTQTGTATATASAIGGAGGFYDGGASQALGGTASASATATAGGVTVHQFDAATDGGTASASVSLTASPTGNVTVPGTLTALGLDRAGGSTISTSSGPLTLQGSEGTDITVVSGSHTISAPLVFASDTTIDVENGGNTLTFDHSPTIQSGVDVTKSGVGTWEIDGGLYVGATGTSSLTINEGDVTSNDISSIGGGSGVVAVTGVDSSWTNSDGIVVGSGDAVTAVNGTLFIQNGATVSTGTGALGGSIIGFDYSATGMVQVAGSGSSWVNTGSLDVGQIGNGTLSVEASGSVSNTSASIGVAGGQGSVTVTGLGSTWTNSGAVYVGRDYGSGEMTVSGGGSVTNSDGFIGYSSDAFTDGTVTVTGAGSSWANSGSLYIGGTASGGGGIGILDVNDGGMVSAGNAVRIWSSGTVKGDGTIDGNVISDGVISPGNSPGILTIDGNYEQNGTGELFIEIGGIVLGSEYDQVNISGSAELDGTLEVVLVDGFDPDVNDTFVVLTATSITGVFDTVMLPTLNVGLFDISYSSTSVSLTVVNNLQNLQVVPEPTSAAVLACVVMVVSRRRGVRA